MTPRAFSGEVGTGSPQKMRLLKNNQSEFRFHWNGIRSSVRGLPANIKFVENAPTIKIK